VLKLGHKTDIFVLKYAIFKQSDNSFHQQGQHLLDKGQGGQWQTGW